ncbi:hypothetical protein B0H11DRAFT_2252511 [Mycena galericulata]|nr:hypothetical protein B0H11DRAFT_2252511 [Mycena galericulata]
MAANSRKRRKTESSGSAYAPESEDEDEIIVVENPPPAARNLRTRRGAESSTAPEGNAGSAKGNSASASKTANSNAPEGSRPKPRPVPRRSAKDSQPAPPATQPRAEASSKTSVHEPLFVMPDPRNLPPSKRFLNRAIPDEYTLPGLFRVEGANDANFDFPVELDKPDFLLPKARKQSELSQYFRSYFRRKPEKLHGDSARYLSPSFWSTGYGKFVLEELEGSDLDALSCFRSVRGTLDWLVAFNDFYPLLVGYTIPDFGVDHAFFDDRKDPRPVLAKPLSSDPPTLSLDGLGPEDLASIQSRYADLHDSWSRKQSEDARATTNKFVQDTLAWNGRRARRRDGFLQREQGRKERVAAYNRDRARVQELALHNIIFMAEYAIFLEDCVAQNLPLPVRPSLLKESTPEGQPDPQQDSPSFYHLGSSLYWLPSPSTLPSPPSEPVAGPSDSHTAFPDSASQRSSGVAGPSKDPVNESFEGGDQVFSFDDPPEEPELPADIKGKSKAKSSVDHRPPLPSSDAGIHDLIRTPPCFVNLRVPQIARGFYSEFHHNEPLSEDPPKRKPPKGGRNHNSVSPVRTITHGWPVSKRADCDGIAEGFEEVRMPLQDMATLVYVTRGPGCTRCAASRLPCTRSRQGHDMNANCFSCREAGTTCRLADKFDFAETDVIIRSTNDKIFEKTIRLFVDLYSKVRGENMSVRLLGLAIFLLKHPNVPSPSDIAAASSSRSEDPLSSIGEDPPLVQAARNELIRNAAAAVRRDSGNALPFSADSLPLARRARETSRMAFEAADALVENMMLSARGVDKSWGDQYVGDGKGSGECDELERDGNGPRDVNGRLVDISMGGEKLVANGAPAVEGERSTMIVDALVPSAPSSQGAMVESGVTGVPSFLSSSSSTLANALGPFGLSANQLPSSTWAMDSGPTFPSLSGMVFGRLRAPSEPDMQIPPTGALAQAHDLDFSLKISRKSAPPS